MSARAWDVSCARAARWLYPALDGTLGDREMAALGAHLEACASCRALRSREVAFREQVARLCAEPPPAPAALHARLRATFAPRPAAEPPREEDGAPIAVEPPPAAPAPARTTRRRALGVLTAVLVAGGLLAPVLVDPLARAPSWPPALVRSAAAQQVALAEGRLPLEVRSQSSGRVAAWLRARLRFPVDLPPLAGEGVEVIGARLTELAAAEAAAVVYRIDGREATLFTFPAAVLRSPELTGGASTELVVDEHPFRHYRLPGLTVTLWERGTVGYALAVPADVAAGRGCALCHVGEENRRLERALAPDLGR